MSEGLEQAYNPCIGYYYTGYLVWIQWCYESIFFSLLLHSSVVHLCASGGFPGFSVVFLKLLKCLEKIPAAVCVGKFGYSCSCVSYFPTSVPSFPLPFLLYKKNHQFQLLKQYAVNKCSRFYKFPAFIKKKKKILARLWRYKRKGISLKGKELE